MSVAVAATTSAQASRLDLPAPDRSQEQVREAVTAVLSQERFADSTPGLLEQLLGVASDWLSRLLAVLSGTPVGRLGTAVAFTVAVVGVVAAAVWLLRRIRVAERVTTSPPVGVAGRSAADWEAAAEAAARAGDPREAVRCRHRALVAAFVADGLLEEIPGRTAGRYLAAVRADVPAAEEPFAQATRIFEDAWYGHRTVGAEDVEAVDRAARQALDARFARVPR